jgi:predicted dehydrogenase
VTGATADREVRTLHAAVVGCGNIAPRYVQALARHEDRLRLVGACDLDRPRAEALAAFFAGRTYASLADVLADDGVELVVNLTTLSEHAEVTARCLAAGKHVYSEKPLALSVEDARELVELAARNGVRLACAPGTFLGEAQQTAWKLIRDGRLGTVRAVYAEANWGRIESWHPRPQAIYDVGPLIDVGVYPLTILTTIFGPATGVVGYGRGLLSERTTLDGARFRPAAPDFTCAHIEFRGGCIARLTANFYVGGQHSLQRGIEFHGDDGSLHLASFLEFDSPLELAEQDGSRTPVPLLGTRFSGIDWARGVVDLAEALAAGAPHRVTGAQAAHVVEILFAITEAIEEGRRVEVLSEFAPPPPVEWAV